MNLDNPKPLSLYWEIRALFYLGALSLVWGVGQVVRIYSADIGVIAVIAALSIGFALSLYTCFRKAPPFSTQQVPSPTLAFDYILYLGCAFLSIDLGVIEANYRLLSNQWNLYVLFSSVLFFVLAYRFDNRLVLSLALTGMAGWFGLKLQSIGWSNSDHYLRSALAFGLLTVVAGAMTAKRDIKKHFLDVYLNLGGNALFLAGLAGTFSSDMKNVYFVGLLLFCAVAGYYALTRKRLLYFVYAILYSYIAISAKLTPHLFSMGIIFAYYIFSSMALVIGIFFLARRFKEAA